MIVQSQDFGAVKHCNFILFRLYGPTWESYVVNDTQNAKQKDRFFTQQHYKELGRSILGEEAKEEECIKVGERYSREFHLYIEPWQFHTIHSELNDQITHFGISQKWDGISSKTHYFQQALSYKMFVYNYLNKNKYLPQVESDSSK